GPAAARCPRPAILPAAVAWVALGFVFGVSGGTMVSNRLADTRMCHVMPEAVIVSTARSPIGRANKGSLVSMRPDDLTVQMIQAALAKVPQLDPADIDDLMLGCGLPGGESGFNMGRAVAVELGYDHLPGCTITRYCSSSLQTTRMAFHAIKAGEGDVFISAGVETVSRFARGSSDGLPAEAQALVGGGWQNPRFAQAMARTKAAAQGGTTWHDPRADGL